jgi:transcriptional regulator with XRE-family HTH domain
LLLANILTMTIKDLQDQLRTHIRARIQRGEWTGSSLSGEAGFQQGHLSNFLNARRGLSLEAMDRLLEVLNIGILDLVKAEDVRRAVLPGPPAQIEEVALVSAENAALARFSASQILETYSFSRSFLRKLKPNDAGDRANWLRFVLIKLDAGSAGVVLPLEISRITLLIDRHYSSLKPYRRFRPNLYALRLADRCFLGYVSVSGDRLVLRPNDPRAAVAVVRIERGRSYSDYILGRVCHVGAEV